MNADTSGNKTVAFTPRTRNRLGVVGRPTRITGTAMAAKPKPKPKPKPKAKPKAKPKPGYGY